MKRSSAFQGTIVGLLAGLTSGTQVLQIPKEVKARAECLTGPSGHDHPDLISLIGTACDILNLMVSSGMRGAMVLNSPGRFRVIVAILFRDYWDCCLIMK